MSAWSFYDPVDGQTYVFAVNPNKMTTPYVADTLNAGARSASVPLNVTAQAGVAVVTQGKVAPLQWSFSGNVRSKSQYRTFEYWKFKTNRIHVTDHLARTWEIVISSIDWTEQIPTRQTPYRYTYTVNAMLYGQVS